MGIIMPVYKIMLDFDVFDHKALITIELDEEHKDGDIILITPAMHSKILTNSEYVKAMGEVPVLGAVVNKMSENGMRPSQERNPPFPP